MKAVYSLALIAVLATGCAHTHTPPATPTQTPSVAQDEPPARYWSSGYSVVNNTIYLLDLVQDGEIIASRIRPGQVFPLQSLWLRRVSNVTAIGFEKDGTYVGTDTHIFSNRYSEVWTVTGLVPQGGRW